MRSSCQKIKFVIIIITVEKITVIMPSVFMESPSYSHDRGIHLVGRNQKKGVSIPPLSLIRVTRCVEFFCVSEPDCRDVPLLALCSLRKHAVRIGRWVVVEKDAMSRSCMGP
jgi:hypothetical protein